MRYLLFVAILGAGCARYDYPPPSDGGRNIRVDRVSGRTEVLTRAGWKSINPTPAPPLSKEASALVASYYATPPTTLSTAPCSREEYAAMLTQQESLSPRLQLCKNRYYNH